MTPAVSGILLAAGHGRRFGAGNKLLADWRGAPVIVHAAKALRQALGPRRLIAVVRDPRVAALLPGFRIVMAGEAETMSDSLRLGLAAATDTDTDAASALIALGDMPAVPPAHLSALVRACTPGRAAASGYITAAGPHTGVPACLPRSMFGDAIHIQGDVGARALLRGATLVPLPPGAQHDIDRAEDLGLRPHGH